MAYAVHIYDPTAEMYYRRSIWFSASRKADAERSLRLWKEEAPCSKPVLVYDMEEQGE